MTPTFRAPAILAVALLAATPALAQSTATPAPAPAATAQAPSTLPDIVLGDANAPVTVIEYASFTCPHCAAFHDESFDDLKAEYVDTGKVKFIQRDVYLDQIGLWAGVLARCGGDDKYYAVSDMLFGKQRQWLDASSGEQLTANLRKLGTTAGFTDAQMEACWADQSKVEQLVATFQKNATADGVEGTPTFIIGGEKVANAPWPELKAKIDEKLAATSQPATN